MLDSDTYYSKESEIDRAFPYINILDDEINKLKFQINQMNKYYQKQNFIKKLLMPKFPIDIAQEDSELKRKYFKMKKYFKDGYSFLLRATKVYKNEDIEEPCYYEFFVNIKYNLETKNKQFYKRFTNIKELNEYMKDMEGVFKHLTRRDLMERLFKEKKEEIEYLKNLF